MDDCKAPSNCTEAHWRWRAGAGRGGAALVPLRAGNGGTDTTASLRRQQRVYFNVEVHTKSMSVFLKLRGSGRALSELFCYTLLSPNHDAAIPVRRIEVCYGASAEAVSLRRKEKGCRNILLMRPGGTSPPSTGTRAAAPTSAPPGARPQRPAHMYARPTGSGAPAPTVMPPGARS